MTQKFKIHVLSCKFYSSCHVLRLSFVGEVACISNVTCSACGYMDPPTHKYNLCVDTCPSIPGCECIIETSCYVCVAVKQFMFVHTIV